MAKMASKNFDPSSPLVFSGTERIHQGSEKTNRAAWPSDQRSVSFPTGVAHAMHVKKEEGFNQAIAVAILTFLTRPPPHGCPCWLFTPPVSLLGRSPMTRVHGINGSAKV